MKLISLILASLVFWTTPLVAAELVMVEQAGCHYCEQWDAEISRIYPKTEQGKLAPLKRVDLKNLPSDLSFTSRPVFTPTFVLMEDGKELGRIEGYAGDEFFWFLLDRLIYTNKETLK